MYSTYNEIIADIQDEIDQFDDISKISKESMKLYILQGCQRISNLLSIKSQTELKLIYGQNDYLFSEAVSSVTGTGTVSVLNTTVTGILANGTGTISSVGSTVTGVGTLFISELSVGKMIVVGNQKKMVKAITSNTSCVIDGYFDSDLLGVSFSVSTTKFTKEVNVGSVIVVGGVSKVVASVVDAYTLTVSDPYATSQSNKTFTVDSVVTQIPSKFYNIYDIDRLEGNMRCRVKVESLHTLLSLRDKEKFYYSYSNFSKPYMAAEWMDASGKRYLKFYPDVDSDKQITIYGYVRINPRSYLSALYTDAIPLNQEYDFAIKEFAKYRIYSRVKDGKNNAQEALNLFNGYIRELALAIPNVEKVRVEYR